MPWNSEHRREENTFQASLRRCSSSWDSLQIIGLYQNCLAKCSSAATTTAYNRERWEERGRPGEVARSIHSPPRAAFAWCCRESGRSSTPQPLAPACSLLCTWSASQSPVSPMGCCPCCSSERMCKTLEVIKALNCDKLDNNNNKNSFHFWNKVFMAAHTWRVQNVLL